VAATLQVPIRSLPYFLSAAAVAVEEWLLHQQQYLLAQHLS
jgi:hypothetical protein